ncbi:MAG: alpha-L-rhamnosidase C-terminal domain-containing protein, partial [Dysgonamonadaceae bacterium]|nr:alpha-L-rhamnosidase C-terminal domain-containing protein [Dysgonamonadaceae bacterium]
PKGVTWAKTTKETPFGTARVDWQLNDGTMVMEIDIPVGSVGEVVLPEGVKKVSINGVENARNSQSEESLTLQSGRYKLMY